MKSKDLVDGMYVAFIFPTTVLECIRRILLRLLLRVKLCPTDAEVETMLAEYAETLGLPYIPPHITAKGRLLLRKHQARFIKLYVRELRRAVHDNCAFVYIL